MHNSIIFYKVPILWIPLSSSIHKLSYALIKMYIFGWGRGNAYTGTFIYWSLVKWQPLKVYLAFCNLSCTKLMKTMSIHGWFHEENHEWNADVASLHQQLSIDHLSNLLNNAIVLIVFVTHVFLVIYIN